MIKSEQKDKNSFNKLLEFLSDNIVICMNISKLDDLISSSNSMMIKNEIKKHY
jgi:hypothetical protein